MGAGVALPDQRRQSPVLRLGLYAGGFAAGPEDFAVAEVAADIEAEIEAEVGVDLRVIDGLKPRRFD